MKTRKTYEATIPEYPAPTDYHWNMKLERVEGDLDVSITISGTKDGPKAHFHCRLKDLENAVAEMQGG